MPHRFMIVPYMYLEADMAYDYAAYPSLSLSRRRIATLQAGDAVLAGSTY